MIVIHVGAYHDLLFIFLLQRLRDVPFFLRRLMRELMDPHRSLPLVFKARMIFAVRPTDLTQNFNDCTFVSCIHCVMHLTVMIIIQMDERCLNFYFFLKSLW